MTIASAITAAQGRIANAYTAVSSMGGTLPATQNLANLPTAIQSISTVNNQDITVTANGIYTAGEGYTGLGTVTVNCQTVDIVTATNTTGAAIAEDDKVWLEKIPGKWNIVNFFTADTNKVNVIGSLNISNGLASDFSQSDFIQVGLLNLNSADYWFFESEITIGSDISTEQAIFVENQTNYNTILQVDSSGIVSTNISSNHSSFNIGSMYSTTAIEVDTPTMVKFEFTGTAYNIYINNILEGTIASSTKLSSFTWNIGCANTTNPVFRLPYSSGYINLNKTKIHIESSNGFVTEWPIGAEIKRNCLTGFADESINIGEDGEVKTVLPEQVTVTVTVDADNADISAE